MSNSDEYVPAYADFDSPHKFEAIKSIVAKRLKEHPNAGLSYSGGSDSDILLDIVMDVCRTFNLSIPDIYFFDTGLEMKATKDHIKAVAEKYGIEIKTFKPKKNIVLATREHGLPLISKIFSKRIESAQKHGVPFEIKDEFDEAEDKLAKLNELNERYPNSRDPIEFICSCDHSAKPFVSQNAITAANYFYEFVKDNPIPFKVSAKCCDECKKKPAHSVQKGYEMIITGERRDEGGIRAMPFFKGKSVGCFAEHANGQFRLRPLYFVSDKDKEWYKQEHNIRYSDAYEVYGFKRTGCCGCPISYRAVDDLKILEPYEPLLVKAAWNVFGDSYRYRQKYVEYREMRKQQAKAERKRLKNQLSFEEEHTDENG